MKVTENFAHCNSCFQDFPAGKLLPGAHSLTNRFSVYIFHDKKTVRFILQKFHRGGNSGMMQLIQKRGFPAQFFLVTRTCLDRIPPFRSGLFHKINDRCRPFSEHGQQTVLPSRKFYFSNDSASSFLVYRKAALNFLRSFSELLYFHILFLYMDIV